MPGHPENPLSWADIVQKLKECVPWSGKALSNQNIGKISQMVEYLEKVDDVTVILNYLTRNLSKK